LPLADVIAAGRLREIPGVGPALESRIVALHESGTHPKLEAMRHEAPEGVLAMLRIPRLSADKVAKIHRELGLDSIGSLEAACRRGDLAGVKGLGPALQETILRGIEMLRRSQGQRLIHHASDILEGAAANLARSHPDLTRIVAAGEYRRGCELVGDLVLVAETAPGAVSGTLDLGELKLHLAEPARYGPVLIIATGSAAHVEVLQARARERGFKLDASGLRRGRKLVACPDESDVYAALGLPLIAPELRETARRSPSRPRAACRPSSTMRTCAGSCTATRTSPTAATPSRPWRSLPASAATATSALPTTRRAPATPAA
jgi:DNA polymerase (family 10)